ncbi:hypothetical protein [Parafrankia discariae]|uniref:hypothetical protein n=1 Tax=Parafrankia discariae TaxID=365528 RepID=UPI00036D1FA8|nr:hypothetical protein [Parafrankia discariae]
MTTTSTTSAELASQLWAADLAYLAANITIWASGRDLDDTDPEIGPTVTAACDLNDRLIALDAELTVRAGEAIERPLYELLDLLDQDPGAADQIHAAAALRVITTEVYTADVEDLQPGAELPAVGIWAALDAYDRAHPPTSSDS